MRLAPFLLLAVFAATPSRAEGVALTDEDRADLAWLDGLADRSIAAKPFVEVRLGTWFSLRGFLVEDDGARIRVVSAGLQEFRFERSKPGTPDDRRLVVEPFRLRDLAQAWLAGGPSPAQPSVECPMSNWPHPDEPSVRTRTLVCAWALSHAAGRQEEGFIHDLLAHVRTSRSGLWDRVDESKPFRARVTDDFAAAELFRARESLAGTGVVGAVRAKGRTEQLAALRAVMRRFPGSSSEAEAKGWADILDRMARDAAEHEKTAKPIESMTPDERRRELVFRLREQGTGGFGANGGPGMITDGPYAELVKDGLDAVPALLDALADDSLTNVGGGGPCDCNPFVERVQDLALQALCEIAGRTFTTPDGLVPKDMSVPLACRPVIEAWYAEVKAGDEIGSLVRAVEKGDWYSEQAATTLFAKDASRVPAAIVRALETPKQHALIRMGLLGLLAKHPGDAGLDVLRKEAASDRWTAFDATIDLSAIGDPSATEFLLAQWRKRRDGGGPPTMPPEQGTSRLRDDELRAIVGPLVGTQRSDVVRALAEQSGQRGAMPRRVLVEALVKARPPATGEFAAAVDAALADALTDRGEGGGFALRTNDLAAASLAATRGLAPPAVDDPFFVRDAKVAAVAAALGVAGPSVADPGAAKERRPFDVRAVRVVPRGAVVAKDLRALLDGLVGKPLTGAAFAAAAWEMIVAGEAASLDADRAADGSGVVVTLSILTPGGGGWGVDAQAMRGNVASSIGGGWSIDDPHHEGAIARLADEALAAPADERVRIHVFDSRRPADD